ncbi:unnamed protein product [Lymnaea stagnalis]|uniref:THD domain-containing protein n=1 Tax=Lymnaea stagnalis TaxID=6523 RepID=A0AAV2IED3_LYMST
MRREIFEVHAGQTTSCDVFRLPSETNGQTDCNNRTPRNQGVVARDELYDSPEYFFVFQRIALGLSLVAATLVAVSFGLVLHNTWKTTEGYRRDSAYQTCVYKIQRQFEFRDKTAFLDDMLNCKEIYSKVKNISTLVNYSNRFKITVYNSSHGDIPRQFVSHAQVSAHIILYEPPSDGETNGSEDHVVTMMRITQTESSTSSGHARGVYINTDSVVILFSGFYYVYTSIEYNLNKTNSSLKWQKETTWFHYVHRIGPNNPMNTGVLLRTVYKPCQLCHDLPETKYTGGIFHLRVGDQVKVCLSGHGFVNYDPMSTYFGLILLASKEL